MQTKNFYGWLEDELNDVAAALSSYSRTAQESPPEAAALVHSVLSQAWDAYEVIVRQDQRYRQRRDLSDFLARNQHAPRATAIERTELYERYLRELAEGEFEDFAADDYARQRRALYAELCEVLDGKGDGQRLHETFASAFAEQEEDLEDFESSTEPFEDAQQHAVVYLYDDLFDATAAYEGRSPAFDRASNLMLLRWPTTPGSLNLQALRSGLKRALASEHAALEGFEGYVADRVEELLNPEFTDAERKLLRTLVQQTQPGEVGVDLEALLAKLA